MTKYQGKSVFGGIAIGEITELKAQEPMIKREHREDTAQEIARVEQAIEEAKEQLKTLYDKAQKEAGESSAAIFEVHQMMLEDADYMDSVKNIIRTQKVNGEYAVSVTGDNFAEMFGVMEDAYMQARTSDVKDISNRVICILSGSQKETAVAKAGILLADDLTPSETVLLDKEKIMAFVTRQGSTNSHTSILARTMNVPAIVMTPAEDGLDGQLAIVDGSLGMLIVDPDEETLDLYKKKQKEEREKRRLLENLKGIPTVTKGGKTMKLYANIGGVADVGAALQNGAEGIGLFRSEFLYLQSENYPSEEEQFRAYRQVVEMMAGKKVIIRTLDIGADKQIDYFHLDKEENPAMGLRAIRICLTREELFRTQLRALYRASAYGNLAVMIPMITSLWEIQRVKEIIGEIKKELTEQSVSFGEAELGIMIETPAAVLIADELAKEVSFFSIGTNDLTQYTLAVDRQNAKLEKFYDGHHPSVLRMIEMTIESAHKEGIWVGICGELAADTTLTKTFVRMGIDELSVAPGMLLSVKNELIHCE